MPYESGPHLLSSPAAQGAVFDKFLAYAWSKGLTTWDRVTAQTLLGYAAHLEADGYAYRTQYLELTTLKQAILWLVKKGHLAADRRIELPLDKAQGTDTYCWRPEEVRAMLEHCRGRPIWRGWRGHPGAGHDGLADLGVVRTAVVGHRPRRGDDPAGRRDRLWPSSGPKTGNARTLKSGRGRSFPIQEELLPVLRDLPRHPDGSVFHGPRGGRLKPDVVRRVLIRDVLSPWPGVSRRRRTRWGSPTAGCTASAISSARCAPTGRPAAGGDAVAGPQGQPDGRALLPPA